MLSRVLLITLLIYFSFSNFSWAAKRTKLMKTHNAASVSIPIAELEAPKYNQHPTFIDFDNYILTGNLIGTSSMDYATAYFGRSIAVGSDGTVHVVWATTGDVSNEVLYSKSTDKGKSWKSIQYIHDGYYGYKPAIAVDPNNPDKIYIIYVGYQNSGETRSVRVCTSLDKGETWSASVPIYGSVLNCNNPDVIVDGKGWVHCAFDNYNENDNYIRYNYSTDNGKTWLAQPMIINSSVTTPTFAASLAIDKFNNVHILTGGGGSDGNFGDKGVYWTWLDMSAVTGLPQLPVIKQAPMKELAAPGTGFPYPSMVFDSKNVGHLWYDNIGNSGFRDVFYRKYENGVWQDPLQFSPSYGIGAFAPSCAIDADDNLYVIYHDVGAGDNQWAWEYWPTDIVSATNASGDWVFVNITDDGTGINQQYAECANWVAGDSLLHFVYVTGGGPYQVVHELGYPWKPEPSCEVLNRPDTYDLTGPFGIIAATEDLDGSVVACSLLVWQNSSKILELIMTEAYSNVYYREFSITGNVGDVIEYQSVAVDNEGNNGYSARKKFSILAPKNPKADLLIVRDNAKLIDTFWAALLDSLEQKGRLKGYEIWDTYEHNGIDASVTTFGWNTIFVHGAFAGTVPTRDYEYSPYAYFLNSGTTSNPKNLCLASMDYLFINEEVDSSTELTFQSGDFAYDFFGVAKAINDPEMTDSILVGSAGNPISGDFSQVPLQLRSISTDPFVPNWIDWIDPIDPKNNLFLAENEGTACGVMNGKATFKTVFLPFMISQLVKDGQVSGSKNIPDPSAVKLVTNILNWFETKAGEAAVAKTDLPVLNFDLGHNYPNPFNPVTHIDYSLARASEVSLIVYNSLGQKVKELVNSYMPAGKHTVEWDGMSETGQMVSSGTYFYRIQASNFIKVHKLIYLK